MSEETWKPIEDLEGYEVSDQGNIRCWRALGRSNLPNSPRPVSLCKTKTSTYHYFKGSIKNNAFQRSVHREVAKAFLPNPHNFPCVNHKDENKENNSASNLEWCTYEYNNVYSFGKSVRVVDPSGTIREFGSVGELAREIGSNPGNISRFIRGVRYRNGYKGWRLCE